MFFPFLDKMDNSLKLPVSAVLWPLLKYYNCRLQQFYGQLCLLSLSLLNFCQIAGDKDSLCLKLCLIEQLVKGYITDRQYLWGAAIH